MKRYATVEERFWAKVDVRGPDDCWEWQAGTYRHGYGQFALGDRKKISAHRLAWQIAAERPAPDGYDICHRCDNPPCCNPDHLFAGTVSDNMRDASRKGRLRGRLTNPRSLNGRAVLDDGRVAEIRARHANGESQASLAKTYGVVRQTIGRIVRQETWT